MRILILDDDDHRHSVYAKTYSTHSVAHARSYRQFVDLLRQGSPWDLIHLDHDLGDFESADSYIDGWGTAREYNGVDAARALCSLKDHELPYEVIIQSVNPDGAISMRQMLQRRGIVSTWIPFSDPDVIGE